MISEFSLKPSAQSKKALYLFIGIAVGAVAAAVWYMLADEFKGVVGFLTMILIIAGIYIYTRFLAAEYYYDITVLNDIPTFIVRHKIGKRETTMCRIDLASIVSVERQTKDERRKHKTPSDHKIYFYSPTLYPEVSYLIISHGTYEKAEINIEANDEFAKVLLDYAATARAEAAAAESYGDEE